MLETNTFGTGDNLFRTGDEHFNAGDEHFNAGDERVENACSNFCHIHIARYQQLPSKIYVDLIFENGCYPALEIQKVSSCTAVSSVALNWSSRPSK